MAVAEDHIAVVGVALLLTCRLFGNWEEVMKTRYTVALAMLTGVAIGAAAVQGLHAQAKPKAYQVTELEVIGDAANKVFAPLVAASQKAAGGRNLQTNGGKIVAFVGDAPKRVSITEWDSLDQAVAWRNGNGWKDLSPQRDKAIKILRQYFVEATN